jgi:hypothetical protein
MSIDLIKDEDADYLFGKLQDTMDVVNQYGAGDLSLDSRTDYLQGHIASVADDVVMNGYLGTMKIRNIQKEAEASRKDGTYSDLNFAYSMKDAQKWMSDGQTGSEYNGNSRFVPYSDNNKKFISSFKELIPNASSIQIKNGQWEIITKDNKSVSPARIKGAIDLMLSSDPNAAKQMEVNAWGEYRGMDDATFFANVAPNLEASKNSVTSDINQLQKELNNITNKTGPEAIELQSLIDSKNTQIINLDKLSTNRTALENFMYKNNTINDYAQVFAYSEVGLKYSANETNFKLASLANENKKIELDLLSKRLEAEKEIRTAYSEENETLAKQLITMYGKAGLIDPTLTYNNLVVADSEENMLIGKTEIDEFGPTKALSDINTEIAQDYSEINSEVLTKLNILQGQKVINTETYMNILGVEGFNSSINPKSRGIMGQIYKAPDTDAAIEYFRSTGQFTQLVDKYDDFKLKQNKLVTLEEGITKTLMSKTDDWISNAADFESITLGLYSIVKENNKFYKEYSSLDVATGEKTDIKEPLSPGQVKDFVKNAGLKFEVDIEFNDETYSAATMKTLAANKLESEWYKTMSSTGVLPIIGGDEGAFVGSKNVASGLSSYIVNNKDNYKIAEGDLAILEKIQNPKTLDMLIENELAAKSGALFINALGKNISADIDVNKGTASITIGDNSYAVPINQIPNSAAAQIYGDMSKEFNNKQKLAAKENQLLSDWDFSTQPNRTKPAETLPLTVGNETILTDFNITATYDKKLEIYSFYPSISFRGTKSNPVNINTKTLGDIYSMPLEELLFTNYADAFEFLRTNTMNGEVLVGAYNKYRTK